MDIDIEKLIKAAKAGSEVLKKYFGEVLETKEKNDASDYQTKADLESEAAIFKHIKSDFPDFNIHSEEEGITDKGSDYTIIIDPLDGTNNFVLGVPLVAVCVAIIKNNKTIAGVVHNPIIDQTYYAQLGKGSYLEGKKLSVNKESDIERANVSYIQGYKTGNHTEGDMLSRIQNAGVKRALTLWSPGLDFCLLASGRIEAIIINQMEIYDYVPGKLIATEAGAKATDFNGNNELDTKNDSFLISNNTAVHQKVLDLLK